MDKNDKYRKHASDLTQTYEILYDFFL